MRLNEENLRFCYAKSCFSLICGFIFFIGCAEKPTQPGSTPTEIQITASTSSVISGLTLQLSAFAKRLDGTTNNVTSEALWSNLPGRAGAIQEGGLFVAFNNVTGMETVQADYQGRTATMEIEVTKRAVSLSIWPTTATIESGESLQFQATAMFQDASQASVTEQVVWSLDPGKAGTIDSSGLFQSKPELTGLEVLTGTFQTLTVTSQIRILDIAQTAFEMVSIPAGSYVMGDDLGWQNEKPAHEVYIDAFEIGKYEVTNEQYVAYLNAALTDGEIIFTSGIVTGRTVLLLH